MPRDGLGHKSSKNGADRCAGRTSRPEACECEVSRQPDGVCTSDQGDRVGDEQSRSYPLEGPECAEHDEIRILAEATYERPERKPNPTEDEYLFVPIHVTEPACGGTHKVLCKLTDCLVGETGDDDSSVVLETLGNIPAGNMKVPTVML